MFSERLANCQVEYGKDAVDIIKSFNRDQTFVYADPPYYNANMGHYGGYTLQDFERLLDVLSTVKGKFLLSSYNSDILSEYTKRFDWHTKEISLRLSSSNRPKQKTEVLTANYSI